MAEVTAVPREQANRKCPYCSAERNTNSHPTEAATLRGPQGARWRRGQRVPGPVTPTSRTLTCPPQRPAARSSLRASRDTTWPGPASAPAARRGLHAPHVSLHYKPGEGALQRVPRGLGTSPNSRFTESSPKRPRRHLRAFQERRRPSPRLSPRDTRSWGVITSEEKLRTLHGAALPSVRHSRGVHTRPKPRAGETPASAPIPPRTKMSGRVTGQPPPGPTPGARRTRCLSAQERSRGPGRGARIPG